MAMVKMMTVMKCIKKTSLNVGKTSLLYADSADILMSVKVLTHIGVYAIWGRGGANQHSFGSWPNEVFAF